MVILFTTIPAAIEIRDGWLKSSYSFSEMNTEVNGDNIKTKIEYYDNFETKKSISIWKSGRKDSVWKILSKQGQILKMQRFNNDTLVENEYSTQ